MGVTVRRATICASNGQAGAGQQSKRCNSMWETNRARAGRVAAGCGGQARRIAAALAVALALGLAAGVAPAKPSTPDARTPDGGLYYGPLRQGQLHGQGRLEWRNGMVYTGGFEQGLMHGQGQLSWPDGSSYQGQFRAGLFSGHGRMRYADGDVYTGEFADDLPHGQGVLELAGGQRIEGRFEKGKAHGPGALIDQDGVRYEARIEENMPTGAGRIVLPNGTRIEGRFAEGGLSIQGRGVVHYPDGAHYKGQLHASLPHGSGTLRRADGAVYRGEFRQGLMHGQGTLRLAKPQADGQRQLKGQWRAGRWLGGQQGGDAAPNTPEQWQANIDTALYNQNALLARAFAQLRPQDPQQVDLYALVVAGDGTEEVFRREATYVRELLDSRYGTQGRSLALINSRTGVAQTPLATQESLRRSLKALAQVMDVQRDVLLLFLTSHGSRDHELSLQMRGMPLRDLPAATLGRLLRESGIRHRVVIVSACYSGGFVPALRDPHTLVITASRADRASFGCADENEFTYFGRALFKEVLAKPAAAGLGLSQAFSQASALVQQWERALQSQPGEGQAAATELPPEARLDAMPAAVQDLAQRSQERIEHSEPMLDASPEYLQWLDQHWQRWQQPAR
ncbi:peptidase C13 [Vandammella animalimorsus]|uniref:Peptidase C13 n=2 Tax=Vandammella animalimorsus TaxID=2029117 RepID=A0A2A2T460_9BURK|nr:peptidase C13 [Vandammella animalimorsus]PAX16217.1 peptidase C13 [Vandammella animalimorsus]PAX18246.1 peptidase C13 [Vandammella animalimorsus]